MAILTLASMGVNGADGPDVAWITSLQTPKASLLAWEPQPTSAQRLARCRTVCIAAAAGGEPLNLLPLRCPCAGAAAGPAYHQHGG